MKKIIFSDFQNKLLNLYKTRPDFVLPHSRLVEISKFVESGLKDFSISRQKSKMSWGVPVPGDDEHIMYVWFDALTNYISTLGWPENDELFKKFWINGTPVQYCGQDNLRQQSAIWQAILMAANLPNSYQILVNGFITGENGIKMSKTLGNTINPAKLIEYYGHEALRYYLIRHIHPWNGSPVSYKSFHDAYVANLVNGLGNVTSRLLTMTEKYLEEKNDIDGDFHCNDWDKAMEDFRFDIACDIIWEKISNLDKEISITEPFKLIKSNKDRAVELLKSYIEQLTLIAKMLKPILPETSNLILDAIKENKKPNNLFDRKDIVKE